MTDQKTYNTQTKQFKLKPTTPRVRREVRELEVRQQAELDIPREDYTSAKASEIKDRHIVELFCEITEGPHEELDLDEIDLHFAEEVINDFLPEHERILKRLMASYG